jgi:hypothetical protein
MAPQSTVPVQTLSLSVQFIAWRCSFFCLILRHKFKVRWFRSSRFCLNSVGLKLSKNHRCSVLVSVIVLGRFKVA